MGYSAQSRFGPKSGEQSKRRVWESGPHSIYPKCKTGFLETSVELQGTSRHSQVEACFGFLYKHFFASLNTVDGRDFAPLGNHGKPFFIGIYRGIIIPGFLRWCRISSIHSIVGKPAHPTTKPLQIAATCKLTSIQARVSPSPSKNGGFMNCWFHVKTGGVLATLSWLLHRMHVELHLQTRPLQ